jgi:CheY-like chemotaxis protein
MRASNAPILLVEDDANDVFFFGRAMKHAGLECPLLVARDGCQAIAFFSGDGASRKAGQEQLPCLVVLDLNIPNKTGLEVLEWIHAHAPDPAVPVVVLTSSTSDLDMCDAYRLGANSYLNKPSQPDDLIELLRVFKFYWFHYNRVPLPCGGELSAPSDSGSPGPG